MDAGLHPRLELSHRAIGFGQTDSNLYFEPGTGKERLRRDPGKDVARDQAHDDAVGVVDDSRIIDLKAEGRGRGHAGVNCAPDF
jgi:hypothetical protein